MTRTQHGGDSMAARLVAAVAVAFQISGLPLYHSVLDSLVMFAALESGRAGYGYLAWPEWCASAILGNFVGCAAARSR